ncbi:MAG: helix-turn-helix transcriptional regulator [Erysipelotrichales bacterium]
MKNYQYIKDALEANNKSISWLADEIGASKGYVSKIINNKISEPGNTKLNAIHQALNISDLSLNYSKIAYLVDVNKISIQKYIYLANNSINASHDIYILFNSKSEHKNINLKRFYDYLNFSSSKIYVVNDAELKKVLNKKDYTNVIMFNEEFSYLDIDEIENEIIEEEEELVIKEIRNRAMLLLSNDNNKLSIILNVLKLKSDYLIEDFSIFKDVDYMGNALITNQISIIEQIHRSCMSNRRYVTGNEYLSMIQNNDVSNSKKDIINLNGYFDMFDFVVNIDFDEDNKERQQLFNKNRKLCKSNNIKSIEIIDENIYEITNKIINVMEDY